MNMSNTSSFRGISINTGICCVALALLLLNGGCGYHVRNSVVTPPGGIKSVGVPTFKNLTQQYKFEQIVTGAVLKELFARTRIPVNSSSSGVEAVLLGEVHSVSASPVTFGTETTFGSAFLVTVHMSARLVRLQDNRVLWQNSNFLYRERYVLNHKLNDFFSEENPALERLAREFAGALISTILSGSKP